MEQDRHALLGLPVDEEELHHYRCSYGEQAGFLVITPNHFAFLADTHSAMFSLPVSEIRSMSQPPCATGPRLSLHLSMSNGKRLGFDGFWERDGCLQLLSACGRFIDHEILVEAPHDVDVIPANAAAGQQ